MVMETISYLGLLYLALLVIPVLLINAKLEIKMNKRILISMARMTVQLSLVGLYLQYIFDLNSPILNLGYLVLMMVIASFSVTNSTGLNLKRIYFPIFVSMMIPNIVLLFFFNAIVIDLNNVFEARYMITIAGMLLGNVLNGDIVGLNTFYKGVTENEKIVNYDLALGATRFQALKPFFKDAIVASIKPTVASMATIGLVSLPGMMTGQILGGSVPKEAIMYQIAIMIAIFVTRYFNIFGAIALSQRLMFDKNDQLIK
jgi:putative ABC transport system permease protein